MITHTNNTPAVQKHIGQSLLIPSEGAFARSERNAEPEPTDRTSIQTISSLDVAKYTGKEHKHVLADIRTMFIALKLHSADFSAQYKDSSGRMLPSFNLPSREFYILVTGYDVRMRARLIDRWHELESDAVKAATTSGALPSVRAILLGYAKQVLQLKDALKVNSVKASFYDDMANSAELFTFEAVVPSFGTGRTRLFRYMRKHKILKNGGNKHNLPYQQHLDAGRFKVKWLQYQDCETGEWKFKPQPYLTGKGIIWVRNFIERNGREGL